MKPALQGLRSHRRKPAIAIQRTSGLPPELPALWAQIAAFGAADIDAALMHLLGTAGAMVQATNGYWLGAVRLGPLTADPLNGWRPAAVRYLRAAPEHEQFFRHSRREIERGQADVSTIAHARQAGRFRAALLRELVPAGWFRSEYYREAYLARGIVDTVWVIYPVSADAEAYYAWHRLASQPSFKPADRDRLAAVIQGIPQFHASVMLSYGLGAAGRPLTPTERRVLRLLLTDRTESQIADALKLAPRTTHHHATSIFRKFGVNGRTGLLALWLGRPFTRGSNPG